MHCFGLHLNQDYMEESKLKSNIAEAVTKMTTRVEVFMLNMHTKCSVISDIYPFLHVTIWWFDGSIQELSNLSAIATDVLEMEEAQKDCERHKKYGCWVDTNGKLLADVIAQKENELQLSQSRRGSTLPLDNVCH